MTKEELEEQNIKDCENFNKAMKETKEQWNKEHYQLIKAKEIIQAMLRDIPNRMWYTDATIKEAEQFLKEMGE